MLIFLMLLLEFFVIYILLKQTDLQENFIVTFMLLIFRLLYYYVMQNLLWNSDFYQYDFLEIVKVVLNLKINYVFQSFLLIISTFMSVMFVKDIIYQSYKNDEEFLSHFYIFVQMMFPVIFYNDFYWNHWKRFRELLESNYNSLTHRFLNDQAIFLICFLVSVLL